MNAAGKSEKFDLVGNEGISISVIHSIWQVIRGV